MVITPRDVEKKCAVDSYSCRRQATVDDIDNIDQVNILQFFHLSSVYGAIYVLFTLPLLTSPLYLHRIRLGYRICVRVEEISLELRALLLCDDSRLLNKGGIINEIDNNIKYIFYRSVRLVSKYIVWQKK